MIYSVNTKHLNNIFDLIWKKSWEEEGYELEYSQVNPLQFLYTNKNGEFSGTLELKLTSEILNVFPFHDYLPMTSKILEIDKLSILREKRSEGVLDEILTTVLQVANEKNMDYGIALIEPVFSRALKIAYKVPVLELGKPFFYKGDKVVPIAIDFNKTREDNTEFSWFQKDLFNQLDKEVLTSK